MSLFVMKQGKTSMKGKTLLVWVLRGMSVFFPATVSVRVVSSDFVVGCLGLGVLFLGIFFFLVCLDEKQV